MGNALHDELIRAAPQFRFSHAGGVDLVRAELEYSAHFHRYKEWLNQGFHGSMAYLERGRDRRGDPRLVFPDTASVFCVARSYLSGGGPGVDSDSPRYARYLKGTDYHQVMVQDLESMMSQVAGQFPNLKWKTCVDTSAVLERSWAALSGIGWIGKNTLLIHPKDGSFLFLGVVLINQVLDEGPKLLPNYCGNCTRCLEECPTGAFVEPGRLDSRRCISYWTLEHRGELTLTAEDQKHIGKWVAGCDLCQEVCPFNRKALGHAATLPASEPDPALLTDWDSLLKESPESYRSRTKNSALNRVKPEQFQRNLQWALKNRNS